MYAYAGTVGFANRRLSESPFWKNSEKDLVKVWKNKGK